MQYKERKLFVHQAEARVCNRITQIIILPLIQIPLTKYSQRVIMNETLHAKENY